MPGFEPWDVVKVPFPYADRPVRQRRPALVIAAGEIEAAHSLLWVLMITSAENRSWPEDVPIGDLSSAGLPAPSVVRCAKVATIDARDAERIGRLARASRKSVARHVNSILTLLKA
jgi:mRNA-degrading endonuclease toxin of MazEF toxin-antitoxin module